MKFRKKKRSKNSSAFDVTALVDVIFLIQVFFLLTLGSPLKITEVSLPESMSGDGLAKEAITVAIGPDGLLINGQSSRENALRSLPFNKDIIIIASKDIPYFRVVSLLDVLRSSGHERISLATKPLKG